MIEIRVTKELGNYEPKLIGPLTIRQVVCLAIGVPICVLIYQLFTPVFTKDIAGFFCMIPAALAGLFGWVKPYGMKTEEFLKGAFVNMVLAPTNRKYRTENVHEKFLKETTEKLLSEGHIEEEVSQDDKPKKQKRKKQKYKLSQQAVK